MLRTTASLRREKARDFLVFGRMQRPARVTGIRTVEWTQGNQRHRVPAVFHSAWRDPQDRFGLVLANWTQEAQTVHLSDMRLGGQCEEIVSGTELISTRRPVEAGDLAFSLPPLSCALIRRA
jgi:hypothetical protein